MKRVVPVGAGLVVVASGLVVGHQLGPFFLRSDPDYVYLLNGLGVLQGLAPGHIDHPGTPLQELAAVTILLKYLAAWLTGIRLGIVKSVLSQPEDYLHTINYGLLGLNAVAIACAVRNVINRTGSWWLSLFAPALIILSQTTLYSLGTVRPEPLLVALTVPVVLSAMPPTRLDRRSLRLRGVWMGLALGAGIATKMTFAPLALFILALPGIGSMALAALSAGAAFVVLTTPIWARVDDPGIWTQKFTWLGHLLTHQGRYGSGPAGLPPVDGLWANALDLLRIEPLAILAMVLFGILAVVLHRAHEPERRSWWRVCAIGFVVILGQFASVLPRPIPHYVSPCLAVAAMLTPMALWVGFRNAGAAVGSVVLGGLVAWFGAGLLPDLGYPRRAFQSQENLAEIARQQNCRVVPYYLYRSVPYALNFGDGYMRQSYAKDLIDLYPGYLEYNLFSDRLLNLHGIDDPTGANAAIQSGEAWCLIGTIKLAPTVQIEATPLAEDGDSHLYRVHLFY